MKEVAHLAGGRSSPGLRYRNVGAAVEWLCRAFAFERRSVVADESGCVRYAELSYGNTIIMLGAVSGFDIDRFMKQPDDIGGAETQCSYFVVDDIDAHYARARAAGCRVVIDLKTRVNGARTFTCRDPENHLWSFGTYDPWQAQSATPGAINSAARNRPAALEVAAQGKHHSSNVPRRLAAGVSVGALAMGLAVIWIYGESWRAAREASAAPAVAVGPELMISEQFANAASQRVIKEARRRLWVERTARAAAERASQAAREEAARERGQRITAEQAAKELADELERTQQAKDLAQSVASKETARLARETEQSQRSAEEVRGQLAEAQKAKAAAEHRLAFVSQSAKESSEEAIASIRKQMRSEQAAREEAEQATREAREALARERSLKQAAWRTVEQLRSRLAMAPPRPKAAKQAYASSASYAVKKAKAVAQPKETEFGTTTTTTTVPKMTAADWSLYKGPNF